MHFRAFTSIALLASSLAISDAHPLVAGTPTAGLAKRSFVSGSTTCHYICPATTLDGVYSLSPADSGFSEEYPNGDYGCVYSDAQGSSRLCLYDPTTGMMDGGNLCQAQADYTCTPNPPTDGSVFKRALVPRRMTAAEMEIKRRQFRPAAAGRRSEVVVEKEEA